MGLIADNELGLIADNYMQSHPARKDLHQKMAEIGRELVPILSLSFHNLLASFNPIPYTPLVHVCMWCVEERKG